MFFRNQAEYRGSSKVLSPFAAIRRANSARLLRQAVLPVMEALEGRQLLSGNTYIVETALDNAANAPPTPAGPSNTFYAVTLRDAVDAADAATGASTITFDPSLTSNPHTINLYGVGDTTFGPTALAITNDITITGPTGNGDGNGITIARDTTQNPHGLRLFYVSAAGSLTLDNLTVSGGLAQGYDGAGGEGGGGGAAGLGGAVFNDGTLAIQNSTLSGNTATGGAGGYGYGQQTGGGGGGLNGAGTVGTASGGGAGGTTGGGAGGSNAGSRGTGSGGGFGGGGGGGAFNPNYGPNYEGYFGKGYYGGAGGFGGGGGGDAGYSGGGGEGSAFGGGSSGYAGAGAGGSGGGGGAGLGGAIFNNATASVTITNSTLSANTAQGGTGGVVKGSGEAGNSGNGLGGAVFNLNGTLHLLNTTISGNIAAQGGRGVYLLGDNSPNVATASITNTIIAQSDTTVSDFIAASINGASTSTSGSNNLIGAETGFSGGIVSHADPMLGSLFANGGPTETIALNLGSPAIDAGNDAAASSLSFDQRGPGFPRVIANHVDIGAFETLIAPVAATAGKPIKAVEGQSTGPVVVATFTNPGGAEALSDFSANINWGDGSGADTTGVITYNATTKVYSVIGKHTFAEESSFEHPNSSPYQISVSVSRGNGLVNGSFELPPPPNPGANFYTSIPGWTLKPGTGGGDMELESGFGSAYDGNQYIELNSDGAGTIMQTVATVPGQSYALSFAFQAREGTSNADNNMEVSFDGVPVAIVTAEDVSFNDTQWKVYTYSVTATANPTVLQFASLSPANDTLGGELDAAVLATTSDAVSDTATVADLPVIATPSAGPVSAITGVSTGYRNLGKFIDPAGAEVLGDYSATINFNDGTASSPAKISYDGTTGYFTVTGSHTYSTAGVHAGPTITINHEFTTTVMNDTSKVSVAGDSITVRSASLSGEEGRVVSGTVASFVSNNVNAVLSHYSAAINWGDGTSSTAGTIISDGSGKFHVTGSHPYAEENNTAYKVSVTISNTGGTGGTANSTALIKPSPLDQAVATANFTVKAGTTISSKVLGTFRDQDALNLDAADYAGTITWGDNTSSAAAFKHTSSTPNVGSFWQVLGTHKYTTKKTYTVKLTFRDGSNVGTFPDTVLTLMITVN